MKMGLMSGNTYLADMHSPPKYDEPTLYGYGETDLIMKAWCKFNTIRCECQLTYAWLT